MGVTTDIAMTHLRRVGTGKGPAVRTLRAHVCKDRYPIAMKQAMEAHDGLTLIEGTVDSVIGSQRVDGVRATIGGEKVQLDARAVVLTTGTFLNGLCHEGRKKSVAARHGDAAVSTLSDFLADLGVRLRRFKTGTTPRLAFSSIKLDSFECLESEPEFGPFSFLNDSLDHLPQLHPCWKTHTTAETHEILRANLQESAMYSGEITGVGPRYCPSIEDKIVRFADKNSHPIFLERETWQGESTYMQGFSSSMPAEIQLRAIRTIHGLEQVEMLRPGYAVEYDMADPTQLSSTLMSKLLPGLFLAGQINGTSGYEEAAGQGIVAGINACLHGRHEPMLEFGRHESFIGVMIDDLVTKGVEDPYRMLTARSEHRLHLRHDNADQRLTPIARSVGLCCDVRWSKFEAKMVSIHKGQAELDSVHLSIRDNEELEARGYAPVNQKMSLMEFMRRPTVAIEDAIELAEQLFGRDLEIAEQQEVREQLELQALYQGYIERQQAEIDRTQRLESLRIPTEFEYKALRGLSYETIEKLDRVRPGTIGQASRVPGVRPADIALLIGHLRDRASSGPVR